MNSVPGAPVQIQLGTVPSYALTVRCLVVASRIFAVCLPLLVRVRTRVDRQVHKTQSLSIKHIVRGCLEGVFAQGQANLSALVLWFVIANLESRRRPSFLGIESNRYMC